VVGAQVSARDRFTIGRHTADFGVFSTFSQGIALFDAGRYAEARGTLEEVSRRDPAFELATVTLAAIHRVQERAEAKARAARVAAAEEAFVVHREAAVREAKLVSELQAIARDGGRSWQERSTANLLLITALGWGHTRHGGFSTLRRAADAFALARLGEQAYQALWTELRPRVPDWFPVYVGPNGFFNEERGMDWVFPRHVERFFVSDNHNYNLSSCPDHASKIDVDLLEMLWLPRARLADLQLDAWRVSKGCMPERKYLAGMQELAEDYHKLSMFGPATSLLDELTAATSDPGRLESIARLAAEVRRDAELLDSLPKGALAREIVEFHAARGGRTPSAGELEGDSRDELLQEVHYFIRSRLPHTGPLFVSGLPVWVVTDKRSELATGPRTGVDESESLRHYAEHQRSRGEGEPPLVAVVGGAPFTELRASVTLDFRPASDWWALQSPSPRREPWSPVSDRPTAGVLVGLREIDTAPLCDPVTGDLVEPVAMHGIGALLHDGRLVLAEVREAYPEPDSCGSTTFLRDVEVGRVLASRPTKRDEVRVQVTVKGKRIEASGGGAKVSVELPQAVGGFVGLLAKGDGYVQFAQLELE